MKSVVTKSIIAFVVLVLIVGGSILAYRSSKSFASSASPQKVDSSSVPATSQATTVQATKSQNEQNSSTTEQETSQSGDTKTVPGSKDIKVRALYLTGWTVGNMANVQHYIDLAKTTEINSYVVDIKDDDGYVGYKSDVPEVDAIKAWQPKYDVDKVIKAFHDNGIHVIGRVVCFKDPYLSSKKPELAVKNIHGGLFKSRSTDGNMITWLNPNNKDSWAYLTDVAKEGIKKGFDEIQFDYVRFPNDGDRKAMDFGTLTQKRYEVIDGFLNYARQQMPGVTLSADVFGIICESPADTENIGQNLEYVGKDIDYVSPMAYPSHYAVGQEINGKRFVKPDLDPYNVVYNTLAKAKNRISKVSDYSATVRPYLQDFTASWLGKGYYQSYGPEQVRQQIKAVYDAGYEQWILWDANNHYSESALEKK